LHNKEEREREREREEKLIAGEEEAIFLSLFYILGDLYSFSNFKKKNANSARKLKQTESRYFCLLCVCYVCARERMERRKRERERRLGASKRCRAYPEKIGLIGSTFCVGGTLLPFSPFLLSAVNSSSPILFTLTPNRKYKSRTD